MAKSKDFESPICRHVISYEQFDDSGIATCPCGYTFQLDTVTQYQEAAAEAESLSAKYRVAREKLESLYEKLVAQSVSNSKNRASAKAATSSATVSQTITAKAAPVVKAKAEPERPKRAPLSPRTLLFIVGGSLVLIAFSVFFATTWQDIPPIGQAAVLLLVVFLAGFGAVKARDHIRTLSNFLSTLSSALLMLGLYAAALLGLLPQEFTNVYDSLYLPTCFFVVGVLSLLAGKRFKIAGWLSMGPIGVAMATGLTASGYLTAQVSSAKSSEFGWILLALSIGGLLTAVAGKFSKLEIPTIKKPTPEQKFLIADITGEVNRDRIVVRLAYLATLAQMTIALIVGIVSAIALHSLDSLALVALGGFWLAAAIGIERIGGKFTESGTVNKRVLTGAWALGFTSLGMAAASWSTQFELVNAPNYSSLFISTAVAALIALSVNFVTEFKKHLSARTGAFAGAWVTWSSWLLLTHGFSLTNERQIQVFALLLLLIATTWFVVRAVAKFDGLKLVSVVPAVLGAIIWMFNAHGSLEEYENVAAALAINLYLVSMVIAGTALAHSALEQRHGAEPDKLSVYIIGFGSVFTVLGSLPRANELWQIGGVEFNMLELWPLLSITLLVAIMALASQRNEWISSHRSLRLLTSIQGITLMAGSFLQISLAAAISYQKNLGTTLVLVSAANLAIALVYGIWTKSRTFLYGGLAVATVLAVSLDALSMRDFHYLGWQQVWPSTLLILFLSVVILWALNGTAKKPTPASLSGFTAALAMVYFGHVVLAFRAFAVYIPESQFNSWLNTITLLSIAAIGLLVSHTKLVKRLAGLDALSERLGSLSLIAAPIIALLASSGTDQIYRLAIVSIVATGIAVFKARATGSHNWALGALTLGGVGIWFYLIAVIAALIPTGLDLVSVVIIAPYVSIAGLAIWNSSYRKLTNDHVETPEKFKLPIVEILGIGTALSWISGYSGMTYLAMTGRFDWPEAGPLVGNISPVLPAVLVGLLLIGVFTAIRLIKIRRSGAESGVLRSLNLITFAYAAGAIFLGQSGLTPPQVLLIAILFIGYAISLFIDGFYSHSKSFTILGFAASVFGFWSLSLWLMIDLDVQLAQLFNFGAILSFVVATWLLRRNPSGFNLNAWSVVLPVVSTVSIIFGMVVKVITRFSTYDAWLWDIEWIIGLALAIAYLFVSKHKILVGLRRAQSSAIASAALSWLISLNIVLARPSQDGRYSQWAAVLFLAVSMAALLLFARRFASKLALGVGYPVALLFASLLQRLFRDEFATDGLVPEVFALGLTIWTGLASWSYVTKVGTPRRTLYSWGIPVGSALLPSAIDLVYKSQVPLTQQTTTDVIRLVVLTVIATAAVILGMRIGNLGITAASTTALMISLVPTLFFRIDDIFVSVTLQTEMKALLIAVTVYVLLYLLRRTRKLEMPSLVAWGIPTVIALGVTLVNALNALEKTNLDSEDWIRFAVLVAAGSVVLVLGAIRKIGGFFYPGIITVLAAAIPYAFKPGGIGLWLVLLGLAALIVWVAVRLDRFTGWLKQLK